MPRPGSRCLSLGASASGEILFKQLPSFFFVSFQMKCSLLSLALCSVVLLSVGCSAFSFLNAARFWKRSFYNERASHNVSEHRRSFQDRVASLLPRPAVINNLPFMRNPNFPNLLTQYDSCKTATGEMGICAPSTLCTAGSGRPVGSCLYGLVCCVNELSKCSATSTKNNTYWNSPADLKSSSRSCSLTVSLDQNLPEQRKMRICQLRVDFLSFSIAQPNVQSVCATDTFQIAGVENEVPIICGDNDGQHMYLHIPDSGLKGSDVSLTFNFAETSQVRRWKMRVSLLPCGANYLAPDDCLQYFTGTSGKLWSFNWIDTPWTAVRQLANQDYKACFRSERLGDRVANAMCFKVCQVQNGGNPFVVTGSRTTPPLFVDTDSNARSQPANANAVQCKYDFVAVLGSIGDAPSTDFGDRFCGGKLNANSAGNQLTSQTICSSLKPFQLVYRTDGCETCADEASQRDTDGVNVGFCLDYQQII